MIRILAALLIVSLPMAAKAQCLGSPGGFCSLQIGEVVAFTGPCFDARGPASGVAGLASTDFAVTLSTGTFSGTDTITVSDNAQAGVFTPSTGSPGTSSVTVTPPAGAMNFTFTYTPASSGTKSLNFANAQNRPNPIPLSYVASLTYTASGPNGGAHAAASTNFTVGLPNSLKFNGSQTITLADGGAGGTFTPSVGSTGVSTVTVTPANNATGFTFTYTPTTDGTKTLTFANAQGWNDPLPLTYVAGGSSTATLNPADAGANIALSGSNLIVTNTSNAGLVYDSVRSTTSHTTGKYYFEFVATATNSNNFTLPIGIANGTMSLNGNNPGKDVNLSIADYGGNTFLFLNNAHVGTVPTFAVNNRRAVAVDIDNHLIWFFNGAVWNAGGGADPAAGTGGISFSAITGPYFVFVGAFRQAPNLLSMTLDFGAAGYTYTVPAGYGNW